MRVGASCREGAHAAAIVGGGAFLFPFFIFFYPSFSGPLTSLSFTVGGERTGGWWKGGGGRGWYWEVGVGVGVGVGRRGGGGSRGGW